MSKIDLRVHMWMFYENGCSCQIWCLYHFCHDDFMRLSSDPIIYPSLPEYTPFLTNLYVRSSQNIPLPPRIYPLFQQLYATLSEFTSPSQNIPPFQQYNIMRPSQNRVILKVAFLATGDESVTRIAMTQSQKTRDNHPMLFQCWASVEDCGSTLNILKAV